MNKTSPLKKLIFALFLINSLCLFTQTNSFVKEYTYKAGEADSKITSRSLALQEVTNLLLQEIGVYLSSEFENKIDQKQVNGKTEFKQLTKYNITTLAAAIIKTTILDEKWNGETYYLKAEIIVDIDDAKKKLKELVNDKAKTKELEDIQAKNKDANDEIDKLKKELETAKSEIDKIRIKQDYNAKINILDALTNNLNTIKIGTQTWTTKNLDVTAYRNGEAIPQAQDAEAWESLANLSIGAWCYYENKTANGTTYTYVKLYNWHAVNDPRGLAPNGYHIPTDAEWTILSENLGGTSEAGTKMKSSSGWQNNDNGTNTSGFEGLPDGCRRYYRNINNGHAIFDRVGADAYWWSSSEHDTSYAWCRFLGSNDGDVNRFYGFKKNGFSVRCLRD